MQAQKQSVPDFIPADTPDFIPAQSASPESRPIPILEGYQRAGRMLKEGGKDLLGAIGSMSDVISSGPIAGPLKMSMGMTQRYGDAYQSAKDAAERGDTTESMLKSAAVPFAPVGIDEIYDDAKAGENEKAMGKGASRILQMTAPDVMPRMTPKPLPEVPNVWTGEVPAEIPQGRMQSPPSSLGAKARAVGKVAGQWGLAKIPLAGEFVRRPSVFDFLEAAKTKPSIPLNAERPVLGNVSNAEMRGEFRPYEGDLTVKPADPDIAPTRERMIAEAESKAQAVPGDAPTMRSPVDTPRYRSGESVLNDALTSLDNKTLLKVARSRGIDVAKEAQLKPGVADVKIISKIMDDFSPEELDEIAARGNEAKMHKPVQGGETSKQAGQEAWRYKVLNTYFPDVSIPQAMATRAQKTISMRPPGEVPEGRMSSPAGEEPTTDWSLENMMKQVKRNQRARSAKAGDD